MMNPKAVPLVKDHYTEMADPRSLKGAYPETAPANADTWRKAWQEVKAG
jgi:spermidine/putrescine transport system substrate-binding protein